MQGGKCVWTHNLYHHLGQWASGKSAAAETLFRYLGGEGEVAFITDREILAKIAVNHILELDEFNVKYSSNDEGIRRFEGELATVYLGSEDTLDNVDLNTLLFDLHDDVFDNVPNESLSWFDEARLELGHQIRDRSVEGKPIVIEAGFGTNTDPRGENPFRHTISDLFVRLEEAGVGPQQVKWIVIEASYETRAERNRKREDTVPAVEFDRFAADGGDLETDQQNKWVAKGTTIIRVPNDHDDIERFKAEIIAAFQELFKAEFPARVADNKQEKS
jgi:hypothetical protein